MEDDQRRLQPAHVFLTSVETGRERFTQDGLLSPPPISFWRNNLTALSHHYNLYFVAIEDTVLVYEPQFAFQTLGRTPKLSIPPSLAKKNARGYLDTRRPHSINHLIVGDLGIEEILLFATDSGNITAYHTKAIREAIKKDPYSFSKDGRSDLVGVKAFFTHWVQESAWGLAIHTNARMIAVSANTPHHIQSENGFAKITIFAFALSGSKHQFANRDLSGTQFTQHAEPSDWKIWQSQGNQLSLCDRNYNYKIVLSGHDDNIPSITFVNSGEDKAGDWLLSTDISGKMKFWHIWDRKVYRSWDFSDGHNQDEETHIERGWSVLALDPASFRTMNTMEEFCGCSGAPTYHLHTDTKESYNISNIVRERTPDSNPLHPNFLGAVDSTAEGEPEELSDSAWSEDDEVDSDYGAEGLETDDEVEEPLVDSGQQVTNSHLIGNEPPWSETQETGLAEDIQGGATAQERESANVQDESSDEIRVSPLRNGTIFTSNDNRRYGLQEVEEEERLVTSPDGIRFANYPGMSGGAEGNQNSISLKSHIFKRRSDLRRAVLKPSNAPNVPTIHCSASHLRLVNVPSAATPHFFCSEALRQILPPSSHSSAIVLDRLNMTHQIPELGIVIVATQVGRCAICTLTRNGGNGTLGFRVDWIVPFKRQERKNLRPNAPLLGIAVGPVQGQELDLECDPASDDFDGDDEDNSGEENYEDDEDGELNEEVHWGEDGVVNGVPTTFDPEILPLTRRSSSESATGYTKEAGSCGNEHFEQLKAVTELASKGKQTAEENPISFLHSPPVKNGTWDEPKKDRASAKSDGWKKIEQSRRYRLMLTYYDHTVLTYEIGRTPLSTGLGSRSNWRNRHGLFA